jgi:putative membrane protein
MRVTIAAFTALFSTAAFAQTVNQNPTGQLPMGDESNRAPTGIGTEKLEEHGAVPNTTQSKIDESFVKNAATANLSAIKLGQLAVQKGSTAEVRKLGQTMMDDHRKVNDKLQSIAKGEGMMMPTEISSEDQAVYDRLSGLSGVEFDRAYKDQMKRDHKQAISLYRDEVQNGVDPQLKSFAQSTLPALEQHQQMVGRPLHRM